MNHIPDVSKMVDMYLDNSTPEERKSDNEIRVTTTTTDDKQVMNQKVAQLYKGKFEELDIIFTRVWSMPSAWTFSIHPIKVLLDKYVGNGANWVDPFAGKFSPAEITNDHNPERKAKYCKDARDFTAELNGEYAGILYDPPYSFTQLKQHYKKLGMDFTKEEASMKFYEQIKSNMCEKIKKGGLAICFGWNTNGFGKTRGFQLIEIMNIAHGGSKNDTIVTVERKL